MSLTFENLSKGYAGKTVFEKINGKINSEDKIGLLGTNGVGKTTLVKLLSGKEKSDYGNIHYAASLKIFYGEQYPEFAAGVSVYNEVYQTIETNGGQLKFKEIKDANALTKRSLNKIGLDQRLWQQEARSLSGGEKTKLLLTKVIVSDFDLLILDEPTNHLDTESCQWLEDYLNSLNKPILIISHDRYFLDNVVNKIWELTFKKLREHPGNYSEYKIQKENEEKNTQKEYEKQEVQIQDLKRMVHDRKNWYASAHKSAGQDDFYRAKAKKHTSVMRAKQRELERLENNRIAKPQKVVSPAFEIINKGFAERKLPPILIRAQNLSKKFGNRIIMQNVSLNIRRGDKIALLGGNGVGKTTLLKIITNLDKDYQGAVTTNPSLKISYFAQELSDLSGDRTILDDVLTLGGVRVDEARLLLASLLIRGNDVYKKISNLSMGEKCRVIFAKLILSGPDLLILDEPTNYLDIISREKMEEVLEDFQGSMLFVSHDRYFTKRLANRIWHLQNQRLKCYDGEYEYYLNKSEQESLKAEVGVNFEHISNQIRRLELELAFLSGKLAESLAQEEKEQMNQEFLRVAKELNAYKEILDN
ncbi:MAG: ABC-F type ribosomal protection protein [Desulfitobacteriaceae bacterium]|nr:ABC-F type ribosomal protection protein [Desulfitobacteriaceae bacterium]